MWRETFQKRKRNEWNETERKKRNETNERGNLREGREAPPRRCLHPSFVSFRFFRSVSFHSFRFRFWKVSLRLCDFSHLISYCHLASGAQDPLEWGFVDMERAQLWQPTEGTTVQSTHFQLREKRFCGVIHFQFSSFPSQLAELEMS